MITALIWGLAFVAQRVGMDHIGPFAFNGIRFALGGLSLIPLIIFLDRKNGTRLDRRAVVFGILTGIVLVFGASLQQIGLVYTTAGKAGFITGLYVVLVPFLGLFFRQKASVHIWVGAAVAVAGMYLLGVQNNVSIEKGDLFELIGAVFWAVHVQLIGHFSKKTDPLKLSSIQFLTCSAVSLGISFFFETTTAANVRSAMIPILYGGLLSVGIAYTLQVIAQRHAHPSHAAIIMSLESVFAAIGGWFMLGETLSARGLTGCALMLAGMVISQLNFSLPSFCPAAGLKRLSKS
jgi:drug/metabolite transporter (DMT)-like permease